MKVEFGLWPPPPLPWACRALLDRERVHSGAAGLGGDKALGRSSYQLGDSASSITSLVLSFLGFRGWQELTVLPPRL